MTGEKIKMMLIVRLANSHERESLSGSHGLQVYLLTTVKGKALEGLQKSQTGGRE